MNGFIDWLIPLVSSGKFAVQLLNTYHVLTHPISHSSVQFSWKLNAYFQLKHLGNGNDIFFNGLLKSGFPTGL